jgi:DHA2 family multidrug resistance protein
MTSYSLYTDTKAIIIPGIIQGLGLGLAYIPLSAVAFTNLPSSLRDDGTSFFNLMRNLGSSIGISIVEMLLTRNAQIAHTELAENITPYNSLNNPAYLANHINVLTSKGLNIVNRMITDQAIMISYIDDYKFIMLATLLVMPLVFLVREPKKNTGKNSDTHNFGVE